LRITWIDNAKALGILAIVVGHDPALSPEWRAFLYTFHVPLFFFLAGYLIKPKTLEEPFLDTARRSARRLLVPYLFFWLLAFGLWALVQWADGSATWHDPHTLGTQLWGLMAATPAALSDVDGPLWFYSALFGVTLAFWWIAHLPGRWALPWSLLALAGLGVAAPKVLPNMFPWNLNVICVATLFYTAGYLMQRGQWLSSIRLPPPLVSLLAAVGLISTVCVARLNHQPDLAWENFGDSYFLYLMGAFAGILATLMVGSLLPPSRVAKFLSENSLILFSLHYPFFVVTTAVAVDFFHQPSDFSDRVPALFYPAVSLVVCVPLCFVLRRYAPWALGLNAAHRLNRA